MQIGNKRIITTLIQRKKFPVYDLYDILLEDVPILFGDEQTCGLGGEGRRDREEWLRYEVKLNHMITLESIELSFFYNIIPLFIYLGKTRKINKKIIYIFEQSMMTSGANNVTKIHYTIDS